MNKALVQLCLDAYIEGRETWRSEGDTEVLLRTINQVHCLAFRGTEFNFGGLKDIWSDLRVSPWYDERTGWCRKGFLRAAQGIWPQISEFVMRPAVPICLTGHSLGGAVACIVARLMIHYGKLPVRLTTFGCPKPGWDDLIERLSEIEPQDHFVNRGDPVPHLPCSGAYPRPRRSLAGDKHRLSEYKVFVPD